MSIHQAMPEDVTIGDLISLPILADARVLAGRAGLDRAVRGVNVMEVPDILDWVKPGELLLTTAYPLRDDAAGLDTLVPHLDERGLAAIAVKPARYIDRIPVSMIEAADRLGFPLLELPPSASFSDIIASVLKEILNAQAARLERSAAIHDRFTSIALSGGGLRQIAEALAEFVDRPVSIVDAHGVVQWRTSHESPDQVDAEDGVVVQPIQVAGDRYGTILVADQGRTLATDRLEAIEYAATVAALRQVQTRAIAEADRRFQTVCLEELVTGHVVDRSVLMEQANAFGWDLALPRRVLLAELDGPLGRGPATPPGATDDQARRTRLADGVATALGHDAITWERSREIAALVPTTDPGGVRALALAIQAEATRRLPDASVSVGVGRTAADPLALDESFLEARRALVIGRWRRLPGAVTIFDELGVDRLLAVVPDPEIASFCESILGRLEAADAERGTDLIRTLDTFLESRNAALTARRLFIHYNTVQNRLARIEDVIGPYLDDPDRCLSLALALRLRQRPMS